MKTNNNENMCEYKLIRQKRRTLSLVVQDGKLIVKAPIRLSEREINNFIVKHGSWIEKQLKKSKEAGDVPKLSDFEKEEIRKVAKAVIPERVEHYSKLMGLSYGKISIHFAKTRWGSCTSKGNLNFNAMLVTVPDEVMDSVVVHELCHLIEMNHSADFYKQVYKWYPNYDTANNWLKKNGHIVLSRI